MRVAARLARPGDLPAVQDLCRAYRQLLIDRSRDLPAFIAHYYAEEAFEDLLADLPRRHAPPGAIFVAEAEGGIIGCAMTHEIAPGTAEIKRVFVAPAARGHGAAEALFQLAMDHAAGAGFDRMVLDTFISLKEAQKLYDKMGFSPSEPFYEPAPDLAPYIRFYDRALTPPHPGG